MGIEINNQTRRKISKHGLVAVFKSVIKFLSKSKKLKSEFVLSLALVSSKEIAKINLCYRKKNEPTDVLSFAYHSNKENFYGEIILCPEIIKKNSKLDGVSFDFELRKNLIHGMLHIFGFKHGKIMFQIQEAIINKLA